MKRKTMKILALVMVLAIAMSMLAGCGGTAANNTANNTPANNTENSANTVPENSSNAVEPANSANTVEPGNTTDPSNTTDPANTVDPSNTADPTNTVDPSNTADPTNTVDPANTVEPEDPDAVTVRTVEELLNAIKPGAHITVEPGTYNISEFIKQQWDSNVSNWNAAHPFVKISEVFDGLELIIKNADGMSISGAGSCADTVLLAEPRYADVMVFEGCSDISLSNMTMGHTDTGDCDGDVIFFDGCSNIQLRGLDLFGCGVYALHAINCSGGLLADACTLRDCSQGAFYIEESIGDFVFENSTLTGSESYPYFYNPKDSKLILRKCKLGVRETEGLTFTENAVMEDCELSEIENYPPDYEPGAAFSPQDLVWVDAKDMDFPMSCYGYMMTDVDTDVLDAEYEPYFDIRDGEILSSYVGVYADKTAELTGFLDKAVKFTWDYNENGSISLTSDTVNCVLSFYKSGPEGYELYWSKLEIDTYAVWSQIL